MVKMNNYWVYVEMTFYVLFIIGTAADTGTNTILIKHQPNKLYLHQHIVDGSMEIFPEKLQITIYLTKLPGLLFYGFHKTDDVVCILEEKDIILIYQGQHYKTSLQQLCKCDPCLYQPITFTFQVNDVIKINCNGHEVVKNKLPSMMDGHLIHSFKYSIYNDGAHLYLINIPSFINHTYQYETLAGCIQKVKYRDFSLENTLGHSDVSNNCIPHCNVTTCNGGRCLETFDDPPLCDCQFLYKNGNYCSADLGHGFYANINLQFNVLKLTWNSSVEKIFVISTNEFQSIRVLQKTISLQVSFVGQKYDKTIAIDKNYSSTNQHIMIIFVDKLMVNIMYKSHKMMSWRNVTTLLPEYLFNLQYSTITFLNNKHTEEGDLVYKTHRSDYKWLGFKENSNIGKPSQNLYKILNGIGITIGILCITIVILYITIGILYIVRDTTNIISDILGIIGGILLIISGILVIISGIFFITYIKEDILRDILNIISGILFITIGILIIAKITKVITDIQFGISSGILCIVSGIILITIGILFINDKDTNITIGIFFIIGGILFIISGILVINPTRIKEFYKLRRKFLKKPKSSLEDETSLNKNKTDNVHNTDEL